MSAFFRENVDDLTERTAAVRAGGGDVAGLHAAIRRALRENVAYVVVEKATGLTHAEVERIRDER